MNLFRIHIRPKGGIADMRTVFNYCRSNGLLGVGWRTDSNRNTKDWNEYISEASDKYDGNLQICEYIKNNVQMGDLVWTRDENGQYYLARVVSGWEYWISQKAVDDDIDIANIFRVVFESVKMDQVPGKIVASFRASRSIQKVADPRALEYSKHLWNTLSNEQTYKVNKSKFPDIFTMLDDQETEDLVFLYLQSQGWYVVPNSRKKDTMAFEYLAVNPKTHEKSWTQVKTGRVQINRDDYIKYSDKIFLFQSNELYDGGGAGHVVCISRDDLLKFLSESLEWLPGYFKIKVDFLAQ